MYIQSSKLLHQRRTLFIFFQQYSKTFGNPNQDIYSPHKLFVRYVLIAVYAVLIQINMRYMYELIV